MRPTIVVGAACTHISSSGTGRRSRNNKTALTNSVFAQEQKFTVTLSDQEEAPPTNSQATGMSEFTAAGGGIKYTVDAMNI
jgi:hypothetical protein